jgi:hypothetical protein
MLKIPKSGPYIISAQAMDAEGNVSLVGSIQINFINPSYNIIFNNKFENYVDRYAGPYAVEDDLNYLNNPSSGDYLSGWILTIPKEFALDNLIMITLDGTKLGCKSSYDDGDGNWKFEAKQNLIHTVTDKTRISIRFKINGFSGYLVPDEGPIRIGIETNEMDYRGTADFSSGYGTNNGKNLFSELLIEEEHEYDFSLTEAEVMQDSTTFYIHPGEIIQSIRIWINCHSWDVEIYEIRLYEGA